MSFKAVLVLGDGQDPSPDASDSIKILECDYGFSQAVDESFQPCERPKGGLINVVIESTANTEFTEWMISPTDKKSGKILFYKRDGMGVMRKLQFEEAYCVQFHEKFRSEGAEPMQTFLTISSGKLSVGASEAYEQPWAGR